MGKAGTAPAVASSGAIEAALGKRGGPTGLYGLTTQIRLLAGLLAFSLALTLALLFWSAKTQDKIAVDDSRQLATTALRVQLNYLQKAVTDYTFWDDTYKNTAETFNSGWFDDNFGDAGYLHNTFGITVSFIIGPGNQVLRLLLDSAIAEEARAQSLVAQVEGGLEKLIQDARQPVDGAFHAVGGLVKMDGHLYLAVARTIHPHTKDLLAKTKVTPADAYVGAFMRPLDNELLDSLAEGFGLKSLSYTADADLPEGLMLVLDGPNGQQFGALTWRIDLPSRRVLYGVLPALLAVIASVGLLSGYVLNSLRRGQTELWHAMQQAQSADLTKTEFLANMSHELRTPLNAIIGFSEMMREEVLGPPGNERYAEYNANIHDSGRHLLSIITDVLELSKVEAGKYVLQESEIVLPEVIGSICRLIAPRAANKGITFDVKIAPDLPTVCAEERALKQILTKLLSNAIKFTPSEGCVTVEAALDAKGPLRLTVSDTGVGIPRDQLPLILKPFHLVTGPFTASAGGAGLGLPLTASLVALHGGVIRIESEVGMGTTVFVEFPRSRVVLPKAA